MNDRSLFTVSLAMAGALVLGACAHKSAARSGADQGVAAEAAMPGGAGMAEGQDDGLAEEDDDIEALGAKLDEYATELSTLDERSYAATPAGDDASAVSSDRCTRVCELKAAVCSLEERVCGLAEEHEGEPRYAEVCERARTQCEMATEACSNC